MCYLRTWEVHCHCSDAKRKEGESVNSGSMTFKILFSLRFCDSTTLLLALWNKLLNLVTHLNCKKQGGTRKKELHLSLG